MPANRRRVAVTAPRDRWVLLGKLLAGRRQVLGYTYRAPGFERERGINRRLAADLETAAPKRVNHFTEGSLRPRPGRAAVMGEPARRSGPDGPAAGRPDPGIRRAMAAGAGACRLAVEELARNPGSGPALEMAGLALSVLEDLREAAFGREVGEALIEAERNRAVEEDRAARPAARRRGRGQLRAL